MPASTDNPASLNPFVGQLTIDLTVSDHGEITRVGLLNSRPKNMGRLLEGKSTQQVLSAIPKLFLLCSQAQQTAAISAIATARGEEVTQEQESYLATQCALEWLKEHSWQLWQMERELFGHDFAINESLSLSRMLIKTIQTRQTAADDNALWRQINRFLRHCWAYPPPILRN